MSKSDDSSNNTSGGTRTSRTQPSEEEPAARATEDSLPEGDPVDTDGTLADGAKAHTQDNELDDGVAPNTSRIPPEEGGEPADMEVDAPPQGEDRVGEVLGRRYRLTEFLGRGAMGEVFRAEHAFMKKTVALKILHTEVSDRGKIVERFRREAQAAANIDHPNVCVATDFGRTSESEFFLVMEFLEGQTLKETVDEEGPFEVQRALHIANQICSALVRAHEVGVVHRDLKPDNIMLVERGEETDFVKILDFGIARVRMDEGTPHLTKTGAVFGTPSYMSPEQAAGDPIDHRTDIYSIGSLLFEMLTGRRVFEAERGAQVMAMHVSNEPPKPSEHAPDPDAIGEDLEGLVLQLLEKDPDDRPQTADELHRRLLNLEEANVEPVYPGMPGGGDALEEEDGERTTASAPTVEHGDSSIVVTRALGALTDWLERAGSATRWGALGLVGALVVSLVALAVAGVLEGRQGFFGLRLTESADATSVRAERRAFLQREPVRRAQMELDRGAFSSAIERLEKLQSSGGKSPHLAFLVGVAYAKGEDWQKSFDAFERAIRLEPRYIENRRLLDHALGALRADTEEERKRARDFFSEHIERPVVRAVVGRAAWHASSTFIRKQSLQLLKSTEAYGSLPEWTRRSIALRHSEGCSEHRRNIEKLVELGDPRGLEVLRVYDDFPRNGCGENDLEDCFGCIRSDLAEAMEALHSADDGDG